MEKTTKKSSWAKVLLIYVAVLGLVEVAGQFYIRHLEAKDTTGIQAESIISHQEPLLGFGLKKNHRESMGRWKVSTNQWGFRGEDFPKEKPANEVRVAIVGGSTVFGWGVNEEESIPSVVNALIQKEFAGKGKTVRVINAGVPWYASWHESALVYFKLLELNLDWVVDFNGLNDTAMAIAPDWEPIYKGYVDTPTRISFNRNAQSGKAGDKLVEILNISPTFRYFYARSKGRAQSQEGIYRPEAWDQYEHYMDRMAKLTQSQGVRFTHFLQPVMVVDKPLEYFEIIHNGTSTRLAKFADTFRKQYVEGERRMLARNDKHFVSLRTTFKETTKPIYLDGLHYNPEGNRVLAEKVFQTLRPGLADLVKTDPRVASRR